MNKTLKLAAFFFLGAVAIVSIAAVVQSGWTSTANPATARTALGIMSATEVTNAILNNPNLLALTNSDTRAVTLRGTFNVVENAEFGANLSFSNTAYPGLLLNSRSTAERDSWDETQFQGALFFNNDSNRLQYAWSQTDWLTLATLNDIGSATNVNFYPGQNTSWRTVGGSNVVDVVGTLTNSTSGNAATANLATLATSATEADFAFTADIANSATTATTSTYATTATNNPVGQPLVGIPGTNAYASFAHEFGVITSGATTEGWYYNRVRANTNILIWAVGRHVLAGNSNVTTVAVQDTNGFILGSGSLDSTKVRTNTWAYVPLDKPVIIPAGTAFNFGAYERYLSDTFWQVSTPTLSAPSGRFTHIGAGWPASFPDNFSPNWDGYGFDLNFLYTTVSIDNTKQSSAVAVRAPELVGSLHNSFNGSAAIDMADFAQDNFKAPLMRVAMFLSDFAYDRLPSESNTLAYARAMNTNGLVAAGWNGISPDDLWFLVLNATNGAVITNMSQCNWTYTAGGTGGTNVVPTIIPRDSDGFMLRNTNQFPNTFSNLQYRLQNEYGVWLQWYLNTRTNLTWFSNEVYRASEFGASTLMLDHTVVDEWHGTNTFEEHMRGLVRTFQQASLEGVVRGNPYKPYTYPNRGMLLLSGPQANQGASDTGRAVSNQWVFPDMAVGVNGYFIANGDTFDVPTMMYRATTLQSFKQYFRAGHWPDMQFVNIPEGSSDMTRLQSLLNMCAMIPASVSLSPYAAFYSHANKWPVTNANFGNILKDSGYQVGRIAYTNAASGNNQLWVRGLGSKWSGTNAIAFLNAAETNVTMTLNVTNFGGVSNLTYNMWCPWFNTNWAFMDETTYSVSPTNVSLFIAHPQTTGPRVSAGANVTVTPSTNSLSGTVTFQVASTGGSSDAFYLTNSAVNGVWTNLFGGSWDNTAADPIFYIDADNYFTGGQGNVSRIGGGLEIDAGTGFYIGDVGLVTSAGDFNLNDGSVNSLNVATDVDVGGNMDIAGPLIMNGALATDDTYTGPSISGFNAGATIAQWEVVYMGSGGKWLLADANGSGTYGPSIGLAAASGTDNNPLTVVSDGIVRNDAWAWTIGGTVYLSTTAGALTQTAPSTTGDKVQVVGYALTADIMRVKPSSDYGTAP